MVVVSRLWEMQGDYNLPEIGFVQQILSLNLVPRKNATCGRNDTSLCDFSGKNRVLFCYVHLDK